MKIRNRINTKKISTFVVLSLSFSILTSLASRPAQADASVVDSYQEESSVGALEVTPSIDFVVPPMNTANVITGKVSGFAHPTDYKILILVSADGKNWWDKTHDYPNGTPQPVPVGIPIAADGTFKITGWVSDPHDEVAPYVALFVMPNSFDVTWPTYQVEGIPLPEKIPNAAVAAIIKSRNGSVPPAVPHLGGVAQPAPEPAPAPNPIETPAPSPNPTQTPTPGEAGLEFSKPALKTGEKITGQVSGVDHPENYVGLIFVSADGTHYWEKVRTQNGGIKIETNGSFAVNNWANDPHDQVAPFIAIAIVPKTFDVTQTYTVLGTALPASVISATIVGKIISRTDKEAPQFPTK